MSQQALPLQSHSHLEVPLLAARVLGLFSPALDSPVQQPPQTSTEQAASGATAERRAQRSAASTVVAEAAEAAEVRKRLVAMVEPVETARAEQRAAPVWQEPRPLPIRAPVVVAAAVAAARIRPVERDSRAATVEAAS